ncbi:ABC transporter B family member 17 [Venturia inaequalis]|nr:ABC transporter B family member 17 [Venturia inaequalis]
MQYNYMFTAVVLTETVYAFHLPLCLSSVLTASLPRLKPHPAQPRPPSLHLVLSTEAIPHHFNLLHCSIPQPPTSDPLVLVTRYISFFLPFHLLQVPPKPQPTPPPLQTLPAFTNTVVQSESSLPHQQ